MDRCSIQSPDDVGQKRPPGHQTSMPAPPRVHVPPEQAIARLLEENVVHAGVAPTAGAGIWLGDRQQAALGFAGDVGQSSVFDLASITKTCVALTTALFVQAGELDWTTPLSAVVPWLSGTVGGSASIEAHLSHRAGLVSHREFFRAAQAGMPVDRTAILRAAASAAQRSAAPLPLYSDLGYLLVGEALVALAGQPLDEIVRSRLTGPRGWAIASARQWRQQDGAFSSAVPTEIVPARGGLVRGLVHDDNAWALAGTGLCGHAGLFGTVEGVLGLGRALLDAALGRGDLAVTAAVLLRRRPGASLRLGLDGVTTPGSVAGSVAGPNTFGHLGFTGTSFWCDPDSDTALCFLSNRVYPSRENLAIRKARPRVHDGLFSLADWMRSQPN